MARQLMAPNQIYSPYQNAPVMGVTGSQAEQNYRTTMKFLSPVQQKLMWPTMIGSMFDPSMFGGMVSRGVGKFAPAATPIFEGLSRTVGGASILIPRMLSDISRSARLPYERQYRRELGTIGGVGSLMSIWSLLNAPGSTARALSMLAGRPDIAKRIPRVENFLTGTGGNVITGKGGAAVEGGGILTAGYRGLKGAADYVTGGKISTALATGAKTGGLAGLASTGVGMIDKGITALLSSSTGVSLGLAAVSVLASIRKSMKMAKLQPNREPPDKFARKFYSSKMANEALNKVMTLAQRGVDPQTLSFMLLQIQIAELQRLNMQVAAFRGEYRSENEFLREEKDKGKDTFEDSYEKEILGQDNRGLISRGLDRLEYGALRLQELNPIYQVSKTVVDLLTGKGFRTSKDRIAELRKFYGYDDEKQLTKEKAEEFGIAIDQAKILHTPSRSIANLAPTFESKKLAFLSAIFDVNRFMLAELMTIRMSGFGIDQNILHRKEPGVFKQFISEMFEKLNPLNLPGINALWNITKGAGKLVGKLIEAPNKLFEMGKNALGSARDFMLGGSYLNLRDKDKWMKAAGLYTPQQERVDNYLGNIFPDQVERIRSVLFDIYYVQEEMLNIMGGKTTKQDERLIWSPIEQKYVTIKSAKVLEESQKIALETAKEKAFREGPLGKLLYIVDILGTPFGKGFFKRLQKKETVERSLERMLG
ncbi:MAG TPA: hypothetical protein PLL26_06440, partial [Candidatus Dojkabacteria bacterium]|nr:hypothetical protein [Candidatus Dojkabacteria bacterium]